MTRKTQILFLTFALPLAAAWAGEGAPTTRPGANNPGGPPRQGFGPGGGRGGGGRFMPFDDETWDRAEAFWRDHTPFRYAAFTQMDEGKQKLVKPLIVHKYRSWNWERNPEIKAVKLDQVRKEDAIFRAKHELEKASPEGPAAQPLRENLRRAVADLVDLELKERELQLADLEKGLQRERQEFKDRLEKRNELVEEKYERFLNASLNPVPPDGGRRPDGHRKDGKDDHKDDRKP